MQIAGVRRPGRSYRVIAAANYIMHHLLAWLLLAGPTATYGWVSKSQSIFGAQISEIQDQMEGKVVDRAVQAQVCDVRSLTI